MTTISRSRRPQRALYKKLLMLLGAGVLIIGIAFARDALAGVLWRMFRPIAEVRSSAAGGVSGIGAQFVSKASLIRENTRLREALATTSIVLLDREYLRRENSALRTLLNRSGSPQATLANIIHKPPATPYDTLVLDVGERDGVVVGSRVSIGGGSVLGTITDVYSSASRATLFSAPEAHHEAALTTARGVQIPLTATGEGAGSMVAEVPMGTGAAAGDLVVFAGAESMFSGVVTHVERREGSSFETVRFHLPVNLFELSYVLVLPPAPIDESTATQYNEE